MQTTKTEWTDKTWDPVTGCTKYSAGCSHCYAQLMVRRLQAMRKKKHVDGFQFSLHEDNLSEPFGWKGRHTILFVQ